MLASLLLALCFFPIVALSTRAALLHISPDIEDAARLMGGARNTWFRALVPLLWPTIAASAGIVMALAMWEMGAPDLLDARTYSVEIYRNLSAGDGLNASEKNVAAALASMPMLLLGALALWPAARALKKTRAFSSHTAPHFAPSNAASSTRIENRVIAIFATLVLLASPVAVLGIFVNQMRPLKVLGESWSSNDVELWNTIRLATLAALLLVALGFALVAGWRDWPRRLRNVALGLCTLPLLIAPVMLGIALIVFWNTPPFSIVYGDLRPTGIAAIDALQYGFTRDAMMLIGYAARFLPLAIVLLYAASQRVDNALLEAAQNLGAAPGITTHTVLLPQMAPALVGTFALLWALCGGELSTSVLINQPGGQTLPIPIFSLMHIGSTAEVAALSLTLLGLCGGALMGGVGLMRFLLRYGETLS